ncbi:MAG: urea carboxylase-associated family protein, partial [SAR324 cluster bacterium]|nr:urea carboxylase-associated family protein [SAR324 cluster bacterium]
MNELTESERVPEEAVHSCVIPAGEHWMRKVEEGQTLRILDLEGNQAVDTLFYNANDTADRYSASDTIQEQGKLYLTTGSKLMSNRRTHLLTVTADTCGR